MARLSMELSAETVDNFVKESLCIPRSRAEQEMGKPDPGVAAL